MRAVSWTGEDRFRALCGPEGTAAEPSGEENAPCWPAAMAGEAHPVPSRTRKLSPLAPMVLRCSPWESRTPPASKGRFHVSRPRGRPPAASAAGGLLFVSRPPSAAGRGPVDVSHADGLRLSFSDGSWVLARPARTDPVVRVYAEAPDAAARDALVGAVCDSVAVGPALP